jgi:hypothetical protein
MGSVIATIGDMLATLLGCAAAAFLPIWCSALLLIGISQLPHDNPGLSRRSSLVTFDCRRRGSAAVTIENLRDE